MVKSIIANVGVMSLCGPSIPKNKRSIEKKPVNPNTISDFVIINNDDGQCYFLYWDKKSFVEISDYVLSWIEENYCRGYRTIDSNTDTIVFHDFRHFGSLTITIIDHDNFKDFVSHIKNTTPDEYQ
jgi:hypothetical protein